MCPLHQILLLKVIQSTKAEIAITFPITALYWRTNDAHGLSPTVVLLPDFFFSLQGIFVPAARFGGSTARDTLKLPKSNKCLASWRVETEVSWYLKVWRCRAVYNKYYVDSRHFEVDVDHERFQDILFARSKYEQSVCAWVFRAYLRGTAVSPQRGLSMYGAELLLEYHRPGRANLPEAGGAISHLHVPSPTHLSQFPVGTAEWFSHVLS